MLDVKEITAAALALDEGDRAILLEALLSSLEGPGSEVDWDSELRRRIDDVEAGRARFRDIADLEDVVSTMRERSH